MLCRRECRHELKLIDFETKIETKVETWMKLSGAVPSRGSQDETPCIVMFVNVTNCHRHQWQFLGLERDLGNVFPVPLVYCGVANHGAARPQERSMHRVRNQSIW
jgi:hypothetical protein